MATSMVRKQLYLAREQDRKVKALAAARGSTESEVIRDAIDRLPDLAGDDAQDEWAESPKEFFEEFTKRPDVHEIMVRLARWQAPEADQSRYDER